MIRAIGGVRRLTFSRPLGAQPVGCRDADDSQQDPAYFAGVSLIAAVREKFHLMLETRWTDDGQCEVVVSPGVRWAWDPRAVFLYLSLER